MGPWQEEILQYLNNPTQRTIIWVVGEKGNKGNSFFQVKIEEQYGKHRVCTIHLTELSKNLLQNMKACIDITRDIFLFNIPKNVCVKDIDYNLLEYVKDGKAISFKFMTKKMLFKTSNVIIVFSNMYPDTKDFLEDRWMIFKINTYMVLKEVTDDGCRVKNSY